MKKYLSFGQLLKVFEKSVQDKGYDVHANSSLLHGEVLHILTLQVTFAVVFFIIVLLTLHLIQHVPYC